MRERRQARLGRAHEASWFTRLAAIASLAVTLVVAFAGTACACPSCPVGKQARAEVISGDFGSNMLAAVLPFLVIGALCVRLESGVRPRPEGYEPEDDDFALGRATRGAP